MMKVGMCYPSAEGRSRDARQDEVLVVRRQPHGSNWLVSPEDTSTAVCLRTGTEVELLYIPEETQQRFGTQQEATATFKTDDWWRHDVFLLNNGRKVLLRKLRQGQVVRVLQVPEGQLKKRSFFRKSRLKTRWRSTDSAPSLETILFPATRQQVFANHALPETSDLGKRMKD